MKRSIIAFLATITLSLFVQSNAYAFWTTTYFAVTNSSYKTIKVKEGWMIRKTHILRPGENTRMWMWSSRIFFAIAPGTATHIRVYEKDENGKFVRVSGCNRGTAFGSHSLEVKSLHDQEDGKLYCQVLI